MNTFIMVTPALTGIYLLFISSMLTAHTAQATLIYKIGPFLMGCASILASLKMGGIV